MRKVLVVGLALTVLIPPLHSVSAETPAISPNRLTEKNQLHYEVGSDTPFSGLVRGARYDGSKAFEVQYLNGQLNGTWTTWDRQGRKDSETTYADGMKTGPETTWYRNGQIRIRTHYINFVRNGLSTRWCLNGNKKDEAHFVDNLRNGLSAKWYLNGQKESEMTFVDDVPEGLMTWWYENGQRKIESRVENGRPQGMATQWYENGQKKCEVTFVNGRRGSGTLWDRKGNELISGLDIGPCPSTGGPLALMPGQIVRSFYLHDGKAEEFVTDPGKNGKRSTTESQMSDSPRDFFDSLAKANAECGI